MKYRSLKFISTLNLIENKLLNGETEYVPLKKPGRVLAAAHFKTVGRGACLPPRVASSRL